MNTVIDQTTNDEVLSLVDHFESHLGSLPEVQAALGFETSHGFIQVLRFPNKPVDGVITYATLGMSQPTHLNGRNGYAHPKQEFVFCCYDQFSDYPIPPLMAALAEHLIEAKQYLSKGMVLGPRGPLFEGSPLEALYTYDAGKISAGFDRVYNTSSDTEVLWLLPLTHTETKYIEEFGFQAFDDLIENTDPDMLNLERSSVC